MKAGWIVASTAGWGLGAWVRRVSVRTGVSDEEAHETRLLVRTRANYSPRAVRFLALPWGLVDATYGVAMLRAIARRAETPEPSATS